MVATVETRSEFIARQQLARTADRLQRSLAVHYRNGGKVQLRTRPSVALVMAMAKRGWVVFSRPISAGRDGVRYQLCYAPAAVTGLAAILNEDVVAAIEAAK